MLSVLLDSATTAVALPYLRITTLFAAGALLAYALGSGLLASEQPQAFRARLACWRTTCLELLAQWSAPARLWLEVHWSSPYRSVTVLVGVLVLALYWRFSTESLALALLAVPVAIGAALRLIMVVMALR